MIEALSKWPERGPLSSPFGGKPFVDETIRTVAAKHRLEPSVLTGRRQDRWAFRARAEAMSIIYKNTRYSYPQVGRFFNRDHTSVMHACRRHGGMPPIRRALTQQATA